MTKIVINQCYGGFGLSPLAIEEYLKRTGKECYWYTDDIDETGRCGFKRIENIKYYSSLKYVYVYSILKDLGVFTETFGDEYYFSYYNIKRDDPILVAVVEDLKGKADGRFAELKVVEIPDDVEWEISNYDGIETIHEVHREWYYGTRI